MGTTYSVKVIEPLDLKEMKARMESRLVEVNALMSTYIESSEISRLNQLPVGSSMPLSPENLQMIALATQLNKESDGRFDVTIGPLVKLWGFGPDPSIYEVPNRIDIDSAREQIGLRHLELAGGQVTKKQPLELDFSAIAKGYGVDELSRLVEQAGGENYLVEIGGELRAKGRNQHGKFWKIGVETPDTARRTPYTSLPLKDMAMATSGDYRNYFEASGVRYSHTIDPSTGYPITHMVASVTVLAKTTAEADGYATAINVMGAEDGLHLAKQINLPVLVILKTTEGFEIITSPAFDTYMASFPND